jgi:methyl-accepting chemotaxis protein
MAEATTSGNSGAGVTSRLSLAGKLYAVFALFALLTATITALSDYNTRRNAELTEAIETASRAALNVERVNSLVYAVVMESRGVYYVDGSRHREEIRRRTFQVQRPDHGGGQGLGIHHPLR